jgi:hypothetical protein
MDLNVGLMYLDGIAVGGLYDFHCNDIGLLKYVENIVGF